MYLYKIVFPIALNYGFIYKSDEKIEIGMRVLAPFGKKNKIGIVWDEADNAEGFELKSIKSILDDYPLIDSKLKKTIEFCASYYLTNLGLVVRSAFPKRIFEKEELLDLKTTNPNIFSINPGYTLNDEQRAVYESIKQENFSVNLIFGVTGSGKTEIYIKIIEDMIKQGRKAVVLVPEIVLTPQYIDIFSNRFSKEIISVIHSRLTPKNKLDNWISFVKGEKLILIGTRSLVFTDFKDVGVIVVDEENDESYKQENEPRYNAKDLAIYRAKQYDIPVILCSATPTIETYYKAIEGKFNLFRLDKRIKNIALPSVEVIGIEKGSLLCDYTIKKIKETLDGKKTAAVLSNRRGFSNYIVCSDCGYLFVCPNCSVSLTYHKNTNDLKCHWCEARFNIHKVCPKCGSPNIEERGVGSQKIEEYLKKIFPDKDIERFDRDSVLSKKEFDRIIDKLKDGRIDILVGTQMLSKGHDISKIGLVVVSNLEELFGFPDFRAQEKALSLVIQTAGRSGRQEKGSVIIQTASGGGELIEYIKNHDYESFAKKELITRKQFGYPPFGRLVRVIIESKNRQKAQKTANEIAVILKKSESILGPSECPIFKLRNNYRYHILIKTVKILKTTAFLKENVGSFKEKVHFDVDPISFF